MGRRTGGLFRNRDEIIQDGARIADVTASLNQPARKVKLRYFVTGCAGFIGSTLTERLLGGWSRGGRIRQFFHRTRERF